MSRGDRVSVAFPSFDHDENDTGRTINTGDVIRVFEGANQTFGGITKSMDDLVVKYIGSDQLADQSIASLDYSDST